jgi:hypothetical protein
MSVTIDYCGILRFDLTKRGSHDVPSHAHTFIGALV